MRLNTLIAAAAGLVLSTSFAVAQATQTLTGTISDAMCGKKHAMEGAAGAAKCTRACVKKGSDFALVVGDKVYTLKGDKAAMDKFAGESATVTGKIEGSVVTVDSIKGAE